jgi:hypothetical protein
MRPLRGQTSRRLSNPNRRRPPDRSGVAIGADLIY